MPPLATCAERGFQFFTLWVCPGVDLQLQIKFNKHVNSQTWNLWMMRINWYITYISYCILGMTFPLGLVSWTREGRKTRFVIKGCSTDRQLLWVFYLQCILHCVCQTDTVKLPLPYFHYPYKTCEHWTSVKKRGKCVLYKGLISLPGSFTLQHKKENIIANRMPMGDTWENHSKARKALG